MGESWIVSNLNAALSTWNDKLAEIWSLLTESPQTFKGGQVWGVMTGIHGALQAIGYGLLVLFFAVGVMKTCGSFVEVKKPEHALKLFIRFALAKGAVTYGLELMLAVFSIVQGMVSTIITQSGSSGMSSVTLPQELIDAINNVGFWDSIPLWAVTLIGGLLGFCLSFVAMWLLRDWLLVTSLGEAGLSMSMLNGYVFLAALFFCLVMNLMSAGIPAWRVSRVNITKSING